MKEPQFGILAPDDVPAKIRPDETVLPRRGQTPTGQAPAVVRVVIGGVAHTVRRFGA